MWVLLRFLLVASIPFVLLGYQGSDSLFQESAAQARKHSAWLKLCRARDDDAERACRRVEGRVILISQGEKDTKVLLLSHFEPVQVIVDTRASRRRDTPKVGRMWVAIGPRADETFKPVQAVRHRAPGHDEGVVDRAVAALSGTEEATAQTRDAVVAARKSR